MALKPNNATKESRELWAFIAKTAKEVREKEPFWYTPEQRAAYWAKVSRGEADPLDDFGEIGS